MEHAERINGAVALAIVARMSEIGMERDELARHLGLAPITLMRKLSSDTRFRVDEVFRIADALGCRPSQLIPDRSVAA